ncbi:MAG: peptidylprolyl isomerase, partial [Clostridiales Family XIII bacterium]|nr:peptidylprolyl isomerase [Clostridiales Family XIII bacterium]
LYPAIAPNTVENFVRLVESGFYDGTEFHRVIPGFMIQGGAGVKGRGAASIAGEFTENGFQNDLAHDRGVLSMARTSDPDSASSQFFIMVAKSAHLDGKYAAFGKVTEGIEAADAIALRERDFRDCPLEPAIMARVRMEA